MISLENKVAVVTGAGRGIGRAVAIELGNCGMRVALAARTRTELDETASAIRGAEVVPTDIRERDEVERLLDRAVRGLGPIDILVNSAGIGMYGPLTGSTDVDFDAVLNTNLKGIFFACRYVLPSMIERKRGHIINIASIAGKVGSANRTLYCASKFGVVGFSHALAEEVRQDGIRVTVICPGSTNTAFSPENKEGKSRERMLQPADVAGAVRMIVASEPNSFISEVVMRPTRKP